MILIFYVFEITVINIKVYGTNKCTGNSPVYVTCISYTLVNNGNLPVLVLKSNTTVNRQTGDKCNVRGS